MIFWARYEQDLGDRRLIAELAADPANGIVIGNQMMADNSPATGIQARRRTSTATRPTVGRPRITHAFRQDVSTVALTIAHDAGTDPVAPLLAASGQGVLASPGNDRVVPHRRLGHGPGDPSFA